jgi:hypothetical protein
MNVLCLKDTFAVHLLCLKGKSDLIPGGNVVIAQADYWKRVEVRGLNSSSPLQVQASLYKCPPGACLGSVKSLTLSTANYCFVYCILSC